MKRILALCFAATLGLGGCQTAPGSTVTSAVNVAKKGLTEAHNLHAAAAVALRVAAQSGALHGTAAATARKLLNQSEDYLKAGDAAVAIGDSVGAEASFGAAQALLTEVLALTKK